ncbi:hypothetical protein EON65_28430 [archaeon]|nr:MAG: hypothetical protein EON65_28430 [archaeon]
MILGTLRSKLTSNALTSVGIAKHIIRNQGMRGLYPSYRATLARNIPSAAVSSASYIVI